MSKVVLPIPSEKNHDIKVGDELWIQVDKDCKWCYKDDSKPPCFPDKLLKDGSYTRTDLPNPHGPYTAVNPGRVSYNSTPPGIQCLPGDTDTPHSIVVS